MGVALTEGPTPVRTSIGDVRATYAYNAWLLLETPRGDVQRQVTSRRQLEAMLRELGLMDDEAGRVAKELWLRRPGDAATVASNPDRWLPAFRAIATRPARFAVMTAVGLAVVIGTFVTLALLIWWGG